MLNQLDKEGCFGHVALVENPVLRDLKPISSLSKNDLTLQSNTLEEKSPTTNKPASARSVKGEPSNVQLVCLKEEDATQAITSETNPGYAILTIDDQTKSEALAYHQRISDYHKMNSHYKDGKALGIVDRLATRILTEMVLDFQKDEMNNLIQTLYNLEFE